MPSGPSWSSQERGSFPSTAPGMMRSAMGRAGSVFGGGGGVGADAALVPRNTSRDGNVPMVAGRGVGADGATGLAVGGAALAAGAAGAGFAAGAGLAAGADFAAGAGFAAGAVFGDSATAGRGAGAFTRGSTADDFLATRGKKPAPLPDANGRSASTTSLALPKRASGAFCIKRETTSIMSGRTSGLISKMGLGCWN